MKKIIALPVVLLLAACTADGNMNSGFGVGNSLITAAVDNQCRTELNKRNEWRMIALAMTAEKQQEWEDKICGCASEEAPNQMTANEMVQIVNPATRTQAVASVTAKTVTACMKRLYR
ncbi:hypothetical protein [Neisseria sp.]|uniref:hypothetical protein n=1 Tax=Neisseria sp. TaxID=192066 RepID=UPI0026DBFC19|nr:hypothetical protein [Neisseria sp.]MDO4907012.1 hypothetical protein [Neisseria sp.]